MSKIYLLLASLLLLVPLARIQAEEESYLTRAQAAKFLLTYSRVDLPEIAYFGEYPDVLGKQWYTTYILTAIELGMIDTDPSGGLLYPHKVISRAEFLKMMSIAFGLKRNLAHNYTDTTGDWYKPYIGLASRYRLFSDDQDGTVLNPAARIKKSDAENALEQLFLKEPKLKPKNLDHRPRVDALSVVAEKATPAGMKQSLLLVFKKIGGINPEKTRIELLKLLNEERRQFGLQPLTDNSDLEISASDHAKDMEKRGYFSHVTPEGLNYVDRIRFTNYLIPKGPCGCRAIFNLAAVIEKNRTKTSPESLEADTEVCGCTPHFALGENIAKGQLTALQVLTDWMNSEGHRRNILNPQFDDIGIGLFGKLWVQNFGRVQEE